LRVLREELEVRLIVLQELARELRETPGQDAQVRADQLDIAIEQLSNGERIYRVKCTPPRPRPSLTESLRTYSRCPRLPSVELDRNQHER
jgi:hypothetical protein